MVVAGCGGGTHTLVDLNPCAASDVAVQLDALAHAMDTLDGERGFEAAEQLFIDAKLIVTGTACGTRVPPDPADSATCTTTGCSFSYGRAIYPAITRFGGTVTRDGDSVTLAIVAFAGHSEALGAHWTIDGSVTLTRTTANGTIHAHADTTGNFPAPGSYDTTLELHAIKLDAAGCPIGGSLHAIDVVQATEPYDQGVSHDVAGTSTFGPTCASAPP
jgi:hypothetical protein